MGRTQGEMIYAAWDIETCPLPLDRLSDAQQRRYDKELKRQLERSEMTEDDASRLVRSVHPMLGWICCIAAVTSSDHDTHNTPKTWTATSPDEEGSLLMQFWSDIAAFKRTNVTWITFNGKRFDVPWLLGRSTHYHLSPTRHDLLNTYPFKHHPHADLINLFPQSYSLDDLCDHLSVPTSKTTITGADVAQAVADGHLDTVADYCARDVIATLKCFQAIPCILQL